MSKNENEKKIEDGEAKPETPTDQIIVTQHTAVVGGQEIAYSVHAGTMVLKEEVEEKEKEKGEVFKPKASVFFVAYLKEGVDQPSQRPITFAFNGGPGSSSVWLHLGVLGPRRVLFTDKGQPLPPPYKLVNNDYSILDETDLVFIDPVSTGYSRAVSGEKPKQFHDFKKDIESVGDFIQLFTTRFQRWASPKFLMGESYGTTRSAGLSGYLQNRHGMYLNGIALISSILTFQTARFTPGNDLPYILFLPTYTATAWYHKRLPAELQSDLRQTLDEVEAFALGEYTLALMKGDALPAEERGQIVEKLVRYTGLSPEYIERSKLRINIHRFVKELMRHEQRTVGRLDSRYLGIDRDAAGEHHDFDPSYAIIQGPFTAMLYDYVRRELEFESDLPYEILTHRVHPWNYEAAQNEFINVGETLREAMSKNPHLKVFVANGYYDLATPYFATQYTFSHLGLDPELRGNVSMDYYQAGHMMYIHKPSLEKFKEDLAAFVRAAVVTD